MPKKFGAKDPEEIEVYSLDFGGRLDVGETITTPIVVTATTAAGVAASSILSGNPSISGDAIVQTVTGGTDGTDYLIRFEATTSAGRYLVEAVRLPVRTSTVP